MIVITNPLIKILDLYNIYLEQHNGIKKLHCAFEQSKEGDLNLQALCSSISQGMESRHVFDQAGSIVLKQQRAMQYLLDSCYSIIAINNIIIVEK